MKSNEKMGIRHKEPAINVDYGVSGDRVNKMVRLAILDRDSFALRSFRINMTPTEARTLAQSLINMADSAEKDPNS